MPSPTEMTQSGSAEKLEKCAQAAYASFLEDMRELASPLVELQPEWAPPAGSGRPAMPEPMKKAWRNLAAAAVKTYLQQEREDPSSKGGV